MKTQLRANKLFYLKAFLILIVIFSVVNIWYFTNLYSKGGTGSGNKSNVSFKSRLSFYLNQKSKDYLREMAVDEKLLLQMIQNITREIKLQGGSIKIYNEIILQETYEKSDVLMHEYSKEVNLLIEILERITTLERVAEEFDDVSSWEKLAELHAKVLRVLEGNNLSLVNESGNVKNTSIMENYHVEVDLVLALYKRLSILESKSQTLDDYQLVVGIDKQKSSINELLGNVDSSESDSLSTAYFNEAKALVNILEKLENLQSKAVQLNSDLSFEIESVRRELIVNLDEKLLSVMGYNPNLPVNGPLVSEFFKEWKANQYTKYQVNFTKYLILKRSLLQNATAAEKARMLQTDLKNAFTNYNNNNFVLAEKQLDLILQDYGENIEVIDYVLFYRAESYFIRSLYKEASKDYQRIVSRFSNSEHFGNSLYRLLMINDKIGNKSDLSKYCNLLVSRYNTMEQDCYDKCIYLAGYLNYKYANHTKASEILTQVSQESNYYLMVRYLLGIVNSEQNNYAGAKEIFLELVNREYNSYIAPYKSYILNSVLLKLGFICYESGEYEEALNYFNNVSSEFVDHDKSVIGIAWANLKLKNYEKTIENANVLFKTYLTSNHTYEALALSAHCKKLLNQQDSAEQDLIYVENASRVLDLSNQSHSNRKSILSQLAFLDRLEEEILERRDEQLYAISSHIRKNLQQMLSNNLNQGKGKQFSLANLNEEQNSVAKQLAALHGFISQAYDIADIGSFDIANYLPDQQNMVTDIPQAALSDQNVNYFSEYPLAAKEGNAKYRKSIIDNLIHSIETERNAIQGHLNQIQNLQRKINHQTSDLSAKMDLEILEKDLIHLENESRQFQSWLTDNQIEDMETDYTKLADFTGFGMSDITLSSIQEIDAKISYLAHNSTAINKILEERKQAFEQKQKEFAQEAKKIEIDTQLEKIELEKKKSEQYFKETYFETKESEVTKEKVKVNQ